MKLYNITKNRVIVDDLKIAESFKERTKGLLGRSEIEESEGLLIPKCNWIHMFFMKFPIGVVFLKTERSPRLRLFEAGRTDAKKNSEPEKNSKTYRVINIVDDIKPWRISPLVWKADSVLEIKSGILKEKDLVSFNDQLTCLE